MKFSKYYLATFLVGLFCFYFFLLRDRVWFFNDDLDSLIQLTRSSLNSIILTQSEHFIPIPKLLFYAIFRFWGLNFTPKFIISILLHILNLFVLYKIVSKLTKNNFSSLIALILTSINVNFYEVIPWGTFDIMLCLLFMLLSYYFWLVNREKNEFKYFSLSIISSFLAVFSNGMGIVYPLVLFAFSIFDPKKKNIKYPYLFTGLGALIIYYLFSLKNVSVNIINIGKVIQFLYIALVDGLLLRFFYPLYPTRFAKLNAIALPLLLITILFALAYLFFQNSKKREKLFLSLTLIVNFIVTYFLISLRRAGISPWEGLAERYHYIPLFFFVIFFIYQISFLKLSKLTGKIIVAFSIYILLTQSVVFYKRAYIFTNLMLTNKLFFHDLKLKITKGSIEKDCKIPKFTTGRQDNCLRYVDLLKKSQI